MSKEFICVAYNPIKEKNETLWNGYIKSMNMKVYIVDSDYDFGAIDPSDQAIEMYQNDIKVRPGMELKVN